ncbi:hypothetical protein COY05_04460 [Candidatus Peregrinibacteria bacterium CG_4_10_14_0_2_um_filter_38_24]|nr:MAG: hypothetical protein COY05_04460 [Candidatus Peregrinibacteria bacterium CG_4_10_14_0_2_um_filter_38_24]
MNFELFKQLGIALLLSALIGIERERRFKGAAHGSFAGMRTLTFVGLMGALSYVLSEYSMAFFVALGVGFLGLLIASYVISSRKSGVSGATSEMAAVIVYIVGILCGMGQFVLATAISLLLFALLYFRDPLHAWANKLKDAEIVSTVEFMIVAFVVLPLLPDQAYGPFGFFNPYIIWLMVVLISGISFLSYVAVKLFGARNGIGLTGFFAGLVSSTALVFSFSAQSKKNKSVVNPYVIAILVASSAMFFRILASVAVVYPELLSRLYFPMIAMGVTGILCSLFFWIRGDKTDEDVKKSLVGVKNPFKLVPALKFGLFFAGILFVAKIANVYFGSEGLYVASFISGVFDVDAIVLSVANLAKNGLSSNVAIVSIMIVSFVNTVSKGVLFLIFGNRRVAYRICIAYLFMILSGAISLLLVF